MVTPFEITEAKLQKVLIGVLTISLTITLTAIYALSTYHPEAVDLIRSNQASEPVHQYFSTARKAVLVFSCGLLSFQSLLSILLLYVTAKHKLFQSIGFVSAVSFGLATLSVGALVTTHFLTTTWPLANFSVLVSSADKRWLISSYTILSVGVTVVPLAAYGLTMRMLQRPYIPDIANTEPDQPTRWPIRVAIAITVAFVLFGPPWNVENISRAINMHLLETVAAHQAVYSGEILYTGNAATGYGPGTQLASYLFQVLSGDLSVTNMRKSFAFLYLSAGVFYLSFLYVIFGVRAGLVGSLLTISLSPFALYQWGGVGVLDGLYGWSNPWRYLALPLVPLLFVSLTLRPSPRPLLTIGVGVFWGLCSFMAQENATVVVLAVLSAAVIVFSRTNTSIRRIFLTLSQLAIGVVLFWIPIFLIYLFNGLFLEFMYNYRLIPSLAFSGVTGLYNGNPKFVWYFYSAPILAVALFLLSAWARIKPETSRKERDLRVYLSTICIALILGHLPGIIRTADSQILNGMICTPIALAVAISLLANMKRKYIFTSGAIVFSAIWIGLITPSYYTPFYRIPVFAEKRLASFTLEEPLVSGSLSARMPQNLKIDSACCVKDIGMTTQQLDLLVKFVSARTKGKAVYAEPLGAMGLPGTVIFLADAEPAPVFEELNTRYPTRESRNARDAFARENLNTIDVLITTNMNSALAKSFVAYYPNHGVDTFVDGTWAIHVLSAGSN